MRHLRTEIEIDATPARVWAVLTDFAAYPSWNPFILSVEGRAEVGTRLEMRVRGPGSEPLTVRPTVMRAEAGRELRWRGRLGPRGTLVGEHSFTLEPLAAGTAGGGQRVRFVHEERFTGPLVALVWGTIGPSTRAAFQSMNGALKARAEGVC